jgi:hypothetical protein
MAATMRETVGLVVLLLVVVVVGRVLALVGSVGLQARAMHMELLLLVVVVVEQTTVQHWTMG